MSGIHIEGNALYQSLGEQRAELGYVAAENDAQVLWLKDHEGIFTGRPGGYVRGGSWPLGANVSHEALSTDFVTAMHISWLRSLQENSSRIDRLKDRIIPSLKQEWLRAVIVATVRWLLEHILFAVSRRWAVSGSRQALDRA